MADQDKDKDKKQAQAQKAEAKAVKRDADRADEFTAEGDRAQLEAQRNPDAGRTVDVEVNPPEVQENSADWLEGREPNDVVEVEGQRETAEARMARNGQSAPEKQAGATTLR